MRSSVGRVLGVLLVATLVMGTAGMGCGSGNRFDMDASVDDTGIDTGLVCAAGKTLCDATCVDLAADTAHCSACDNTCMPGDQCCGRCVATSTCDLAVLSVSPVRGNQSGGDWITLKGKGFWPTMKVNIGDGRAPVRVLDMANAIIQTPPGTLGVYDVTIETPMGKATTRNAFQYVAAGLKLPWQTKPMSAVRGEFPGVAVMHDGRVLVAGGTTVPDDATKSLATAEIYTRMTDTVTNAKGPMSVPRWRDAAVTMLTGKVLVAGGAPSTAGCDVFDPTTDKFAPTGKSMSAARTITRGVLLVDGRVMIISAAVGTADIYDPDKDDFTTTPLQVVHNLGSVMVRLRDGRVMIAGGDGGQKDVELYDPDTGKFTMAQPLAQGRSMFTAHTLPDGRVMVFGGASVSAGAVQTPLSSIEAFDPKTNQWSVMPYKLAAGKTWHASALVRDGTVLVMGGYAIDSMCTPSDTVDQVDPVQGKVTPFGTLPFPNTEWNAVTLADGSVLGVGGGACGMMSARPDLDFLPGEPLPN